MRVNSACKGFFNNRLALSSGITIVMLSILFVASSFTKDPDRDIRAKQVNLMIRQMGHRLLLQAGDSTSRVLPVTEIREGSFLLSFESEFVFDHDSLMVLSQRLLPKEQFPAGYTVTVHECMKEDIVYGFQMNNTTPDIFACHGRSQPRGCYTIEIVFPDLYANLDQRENVSLKKGGIDLPANEPKPTKADPQEVHPEAEDSERATLQSELLITPESGQPYPLIILAISGMLVLLGVAFLIGRRGESLRQGQGKNQDHSILKESVPEVAALGKFLFDVKDQRLLLGSEVISLTDKECRILELLNKNFRELITRETLMQKVWINEGVITGRSLDMFVSKLRKKLSRDPELRITNVHGKGYKLEIQGIQVPC